MSDKTQGDVWLISVGICGFIYMLSVYFFIDSIADKIGIPSLSKTISVIFVILTIGLISYAFNNPHVLFTKKADTKRALIIRRLSKDIRDLPEEHLDECEDKIRYVFFISRL